MGFKKLFFATPGIPLSTKPSNTVNGVKRVSELGLGGMELEFVHSINVSKELAPVVKKVAEENNVVLTSHGSFFINLNAIERPKYHASVSRVIACARRAEECGAFSMTFHAGFYLGMSKEKTFENIKKGFIEIREKLDLIGSKINIRPETTGKASQFGSLDELLSLSTQLDNVLPCIDFSHLYTRSIGKNNTFEEFREILIKSEEALGKKFLKNLHCHVSGIEFTQKGERRHLLLEESEFNYVDLLRALKEFKCAGVVVCESPNVESDTLLLKKTFDEL